MATVRLLIERIQRKLEGDLVTPQDTRFTLRYILPFVQDAIADAAKKSAYENSNIEGVFYANDAFNVTFGNLSLQTDPLNGQNYITLPAIPSALPSTRSLVKLEPQTSSGSVRFIPLARKDTSRYLSLPAIPNKAMYYVEDGSIKFLGCQLSKGIKFRLTIVTSGSANLDDTLNIPPDFQSQIVEQVFNTLIKMNSQDLSNDSIDLKTRGTNT